jgi:hypothetical protein
MPKKKTTLVFWVSIVLGAGFALGAVVIIVSNIKNLATQKSPDDQVSVAQSFRHPLTGKTILEEVSVLPPVFAVMVENSADAWPLAGVDRAFLVIEAPAEGNIPRFVAFFSGDQEAVQKIGPVRSARPYYMDWAEQFGALYAHVGGSPEALALLARGEFLVDANEFSHGSSFWRVVTAQRQAPHNVYTSTDKLGDLQKTLAADVSPAYSFWTFADDQPSGFAENVAVDWPSADVYDVMWEYLPEKNIYRRHQGINIMRVEDGSEVFANNVLILVTDILVVDDVGRKDVRTVGEGEGRLSQNGYTRSVIWKKDSSVSPLRVFDAANGEEVTMNAGVTWIEVLQGVGSGE